MTTLHPMALDAILINNDRYEGYKLAALKTSDKELKKMFNQFSAQSKRFVKELRKFVRIKETTTSDAGPGRYYRINMNIGHRLSGKHRKSVLACFEYLEYLAKKTYDEVLRHSDDLPKKALEIIRRQREEIKLVHDNVKSLCDNIK
jgi:uncharacterized protein (TIGR02284 family)